MKITIKGDITKLQVDVIVNAINANSEKDKMVSSNIHKVAGPKLLEEYSYDGSCKVGECIITGAYDLPAKYVIHTVGPIWQNGENNEIEQLKSCYINAIKMAIANNCKTIAFPNISTGVLGIPKIEAAYAALEVVTDFLNSEKPNIDVTFVCFDDINYNIYKEICPNFLLD